MQPTNHDELSLVLFNTESKTKEIVTAPSGTISMYTCGPTVYNYVHIGNLRTFVFEDLLRRTLLLFGFKVKQVMNLTDVDDKTIKGALANKVSLNTFTKPYTEAFFEDLATLHIQKAEIYPAATDYITQMIEITQNLLRKGIAYQGKDASIYFSIKKFPSYGRLSHLCLDDLQAGASERVASDEYDKENASDFVLWKAYDPERDGEIFWQSPFGPGRPGWHIECSAMAMSLLGESIDIHVGAVDNIFPHHENEIAQSEAFSGKKFVRHWLHSEHLIVDGKKMSKSLGNFFTLRDLTSKGYTGNEIRYLLLQTHYRTQLNFTFASLDASRATLQRVRDFVIRLKEIHHEIKDDNAAKNLATDAIQAFKKALSDDLNISIGLSALFDLIRQTNALIDKQEIGKEGVKKILTTLYLMNSVIGALPLEEESQAIPQNILSMFEEREEARRKKEWKKSDALRDSLADLGYIIEDTPSGSRLKSIR